MNQKSHHQRHTTVEARRRFLAACGKFAIVTPPAVTLMLASAQQSYVAAQSAKPKGNNGFGNGGNDPAPGNSGTNNSPNAGQKLEDRLR